MRKVKIFYDDDPGALEDSINEWFSAHWSVSVVDILQSENENGWTITVFYIGESE